MKKFIKIISIMCILTFVLSFTSFASFEDGTPVEFQLKADKDSYNVGDEVTITLYSESMSGVETFGLAYIYSEYKTDELEFVSESTGSGSAAAKSAANTMGLTIEHEDEFEANWNSLVTMTFKTLKAGELSFVITDAALGDADYNSTSSDTFPTLTINVGGGDDEEEVFEITSTGTALDANDTMKDKDGKDVVAAGDKVIAIFAKNVSDAEIAAGSYGIVFGGVRYAGQAAVPAKTAWAIKLVGSADQLPAGSYAYSIFSGDAVVEATAPWVID